MTPRREEDPDKATEGEGRGATEDRSGGAESAPPEEKEDKSVATTRRPGS